MPNGTPENKVSSLHFVEASPAIRAEMVRVADSIGYHCEPYADFSELAAHPPRNGIILIRDNATFGGIRESLDRLLDLGIWLPVVAVDYEPSPSRVVQAVKEGALDYLVLPINPDKLAASMTRIIDEATSVSEARLQALSARRLLETLSGRERQVLDELADGGSNKKIARTLEISPRTVEIHRANLMNKLGARHAVEAVRIKLNASMQASPALSG